MSTTEQCINRQVEMIRLLAKVVCTSADNDWTDEDDVIIWAGRMVTANDEGLRDSTSVLRGEGEPDGME